MHRRTHARMLICALLGTSLLTGCSASYNGERLFWKAQKIQEAVSKTAKDTSQVAPAELQKVVDAYARVIQAVPGSQWAARAQGTIGLLYASQRQYDKARDAFGLVTQNFSQYQDVAVAAQMGIAKTFEMEQNWDEAVKRYREITDLYPWSNEGLSAPLYIAALYEKHQTPELATESYERAVVLYNKRIPDAPSPELAIQVKSHLALAYQRLSKWDRAVETLKELVNAPVRINRPLVLLTLGTIYDTKLHAPEKAIAEYTKLTKEFPDHPMAKLARTQLERLRSPAPSEQSATPSTLLAPTTAATQ